MKDIFSCLAIAAVVFLTCGYSSVGDVAGQVESLTETETQTTEDLLEKKLADEIAVKSRVQDEAEREMVLNILNLNSKKHLTRKEKRKFRSVYRPMPKTVEEYNEISKDIKREERQNAKPIAPVDRKLVKVDAPKIVLKKYNSPPGMQNIDLRKLKTERTLNSIGVISPNKDMIAYTSVYYEGYNDKVSSEVFTIPLDTSKSLKKSAQNASLVNKTPLKLLASGMDEEYETLFRTLTIVDWSKDGKKLAVKERIGSSTFGLWQTNLWVYDFESRQSKQLTEVREAVMYWWKENKNVNLDDYRWDILPLGWDELNDDRILAAAYGYTDKKDVKFLGLFSVSADGKNSQFISKEPVSVGISANGLILKTVSE